MKRTVPFIIVVAATLSLMLGCIGIAFAESGGNNNNQQGPSGESEQTDCCARNVYIRHTMSARPQNFTPSGGGTNTIESGTSVSFYINVLNGESCTCSAFSADVNNGVLSNEQPYSMGITSTGPTQGKITFSFTMPSGFGEGRTILLKVEKQAAPVTPTFSAQGTFGVITAAQDGKQLSNGSQFVAGKDITLEWTSLYSGYEITSMTNTASTDSNVPVRVGETNKWVIENPNINSKIVVTCTEVREDGKIQVEKANVQSQEHAVTQDSQGVETAFFAPGDTVYVKLVDMEGLKKTDSQTEWSYGSKESQVSGSLSFDSAKQLYYFVVPSNIDKSQIVKLALNTESTDTTNYLFRVTGLQPGSSAQVLVDGVVSSGIARTALDAAIKDISVVVTVQDGSQYAITSKGKSFTKNGDQYTLATSVSKNDAQYGFIGIPLNYSRADDRHSFGYPEGNTAKADFNCYVVDSSDPSRISTETPVSYILAGEEVRFVFDVPEGMFISYLNLVCEYPTQNHPEQVVIPCVKIDSQTYEASFSGTGTDVSGSKLLAYSKLAPCNVSLDTEGSGVDASTAKAALTVNLQNVLTKLQNGETPTGMSAEDATALAVLASSGLGSASIGFSAEDSELSDEEIALIKESLGDNVVTGAGCFDLTVDVQLIATGQNGGQSQGNAQLKENSQNQDNEGSQGQTVQIGEAGLSAFDEAIPLTIEKDASIVSENTAVYRIHKGAVEKVEGATVVDDKVNFGADRFSSYFIVDASSIAGAGGGGSSDAGDTTSAVAKTGDSALVLGAVTLIAAVAAAGVCVVARRRGIKK